MGFPVVLLLMPVLAQTWLASDVQKVRWVCRIGVIGEDSLEERIFSLYIQFFSRFRG